MLSRFSGNRIQDVDWFQGGTGTLPQGKQVGSTH